jgi:hypothetical protein
MVLTKIIYFSFIFVFAIDKWNIWCYNRIKDSEGDIILRLAGGFCPLMLGIVVYWPVAIRVFYTGIYYNRPYNWT